MWNNLKTAILLAATMGLLLAIGQLWGGQKGLILAVTVHEGFAIGVQCT